jgi:hypothetical protein
MHTTAPASDSVGNGFDTNPFARLRDGENAAKNKKDVIKAIQSFVIILGQNYSMFQKAIFIVMVACIGIHNLTQFFPCATFTYNKMHLR